MSTENTHLFSDGQTGYDYPSPLGHAIVAAASGRLFPAIFDGSPAGDGVALWRNQSAFPRIEGGSYTWLQNHAFYIVHENDYSTWYLHAGALEPSVMSAIVEQGYATVSRGQIIGFVGTEGTSTPQLHFEVRRHGVFEPGAATVVSTPVDPYGTGEVTPPALLWEERSPLPIPGPP